MERRLVVAVVMMIAVIVFTSILFPPQRQPLPGPEADTVSAGGDEAAAGGVAEPDADTGAPPTVPEAAPGQLIEELTGPAEAEEATQETPTEPPAGPPPADTIAVRSDLYEYRFTTRGAALIGARLLDHGSYAPEAIEGDRVDLVRRGDRLLGYRIAVGNVKDTLDLSEAAFQASRGDLTLSGTAGADSLVFRHQIPGSELVYRVSYRFQPGTYQVAVSGGFEGVEGRGYTVLSSLGRGLRSNEANSGEDFNQIAYVVLDRSGDVKTGRLDRIEAGQTTAVDGGPFRWVASKSMYFLAAFVTEPPGPGFGGLLVSGNGEPNSARMEASLPVPAGEAGFAYRVYLGPQDYGRLKAIGGDLQNVNPFGWRWLQPVIRPLAGVIIAFVVWMHGTFGMGYGWVLILFGILTRIVLFPLYQKSMRAQMSQMQVQPVIKEIQTKYKDDPQKLQKETMRVYKEHGVNPLAGCLPMLLPFPILITLFFVFRNTIEFRGVPFLWLPDLSLKDPLYIVPFFMGASMLLLNWIGQRGVESNQQMKIMMYAMPVVFTFLFANFASGLNLYYASSNVASLPQQLYLARERRKARSATPGSPSKAKPGGDTPSRAKPGRGPPSKAKTGRGKKPR